MALGFLLNIWFGYASTKGNTAAWVFWPALISRIVVALAAFSTGPVSFLLIFSVYNFASVLSGPAYSSIMRSNYSDANRGRLMGNIRIFMQIISALSATAAAWFMHANPAGYRVLFPISAGFGVAGAFAFFRIKPRKKPMEGNRADTGRAKNTMSFRTSVRTLRADKPFLAYMSLFFIIIFPGKMIIPLEPIRLVDELRMDYAAAGLIQGTIPFLANILGYFFYSRALKRINPFSLMLLSLCVSLPRSLSIALATESVHIVPGVFLSSFGNAGSDLLSHFTILYFSGPENIALYMGVHLSLIGLRTLIGPIVGIFLHETLKISLSHLYLIVFFLQGAGIVAFALFIRKSILRRAR